MKKYSRHIFVPSLRTENKPHFSAENTVWNCPILFHWHDVYEIEFILDGSGTTSINNNSYHIKKGMISFVVLSDIHSAVPDENTTVSAANLSFDINLIENKQIADFVFNSPSFVTYLNEEEYTHFLQIFRIIQQEKDSILPLSKVNLRLLLESQLITLMKHQEKNISQKIYTPAIQKAVDYINRHYTQNLTLSEVAEKIFMSDEHLSREFKKTIGMTFKSYVTDLRLRHAKGLLTSTNNSVTDISRNSGFNSVSHFSSVFKKNIGISPFEFRLMKNHQGNSKQ